MLLIPPAPLELSISVDNILFCFAFFLVCIIPVSRKKKISVGSGKCTHVKSRDEPLCCLLESLARVTCNLKLYTRGTLCCMCQILTQAATAVDSVLVNAKV